jgi:lysylphosphatidylglycerol synthetase-like protein (DUF2156 family)
MQSAGNVTSEVASAAASLAGLILVYLGATAASYGSYDKPAQRAVKPRYLRRAWVAFSGFALCLASLLLAIVGKWLSLDGADWMALVLLVAAVGFVMLTAFSTVREIA